MEDGEVLVRVFTGLHKEGTKEYRLTCVRSKFNEITVSSWGPIGKTIGAMVTRNIPVKRETSFNKILSARCSKGYDMLPVTNADIKILLSDIAGILTSKELKVLSDTDVNWMVKGMSRRDIKGTPQSESAQLGDDILKASQEELLARNAREKAEEEISLKSNPMFGMF